MLWKMEAEKGFPTCPCELQMIREAPDIEVRMRCVWILFRYRSKLCDLSNISILQANDGQTLLSHQGCQLWVREHRLLLRTLCRSLQVQACLLGIASSVFLLLQIITTKHVKLILCFPRALKSMFRRILLCSLKCAIELYLKNKVRYLNLKNNFLLKYTIIWAFREL